MIPGKPPFAVVNASFEVWRAGFNRSADGRVGLIVAALVIGTELICPVTGVHGKPLWALRMPLTCQPPTTLPSQSWRPRKIGRSQRAEALTECVASKSEGPCSF